MKRIVNRIAPFAAALVIACGGETNQGAGIPETDTTNTVESATSTENGNTASTVSAEEKEFVVKAGMGGLAEVQMGNLALQKATNADVKAFAQRMVTDHSNANAELAQIATAKGLALPTELAGDPKAGYDHLNSLSGPEFDKAYMQHMVPDHEKDVAEFEKESTSGQDPDIKAFATKTLPTLKEHLQQAKDVAGKL